MEYVKGLNGKFLRNTAGKIPARYFDDGDFDADGETYGTLHERIDIFERFGHTVPQHLLDELREEEGPPKG